MIQCKKDTYNHIDCISSIIADLLCFLIQLNAIKTFLSVGLALCNKKHEIKN